MKSQPLNDAELEPLSAVLKRFGDKRAMNLEQLEECKEAASKPQAGGPISDLSLTTTWGVNWYCTYTGVE